MKNNLDAVFLDFDGVVVESAHIKTDAFYELYLPLGLEEATYAKAYHLDHQGVSRYKKFKHIHKHFFTTKLSEAESEKLSSQFSQIVCEKILQTPLVNGVMNFLQQMHDIKKPIFLLSATPHEELISICKKNKLINLFQEVYGAPYEKSDMGKQLIKQYRFDKAKIIFVGDSLSDFKAASKIDVKFIGRVPPGEKNPFKISIPIIQDFDAFLNE